MIMAMFMLTGTYKCQGVARFLFWRTPGNTARYRETSGVGSACVNRYLLGLFYFRQYLGVALMKVSFAWILFLPTVPCQQHQCGGDTRILLPASIPLKSTLPYHDSIGNCKIKRGRKVFDGAVSAKGLSLSILVILVQSQEGKLPYFQLLLKKM